MRPIVLGAEPVSPHCLKLSSDPCVARRINTIERRIIHTLGFDSAHLTPGAAAAILRFRAAHARAASADVPASMLPIITGDSVELLIKDDLPRTAAFIQVDLEAFALRWSQKHFVSLHTVHRTAHFMVAHGSKRRQLPGGSGRHWQQRMQRSAHSNVNVTYSDKGGVLRTLELRMSGDRGAVWGEQLQALVKMAPCVAPAAHWRWCLSCMAATSESGATGCLRRCELRSLLRRANARASMSIKEVEDTLASELSDRQRLQLPKWLAADSVGDGHHVKLLDAQNVCGLLLRLCTATRDITRLYEQYAVDNHLGSAEWVCFVRAEQLTPSSGVVREDSSSSAAPAQQSDFDIELSRSEQHFHQAIERAHLDEHAEKALSPLFFARHLLSPQNSCVAPGREDSSTQALGEPLTHNWISTSHNTYIVGDQLTGTSSGEMYRRQLLQVCGGPHLLHVPFCGVRLRENSSTRLTLARHAHVSLRAGDSWKSIVGMARQHHQW